MILDDTDAIPVAAEERWVQADPAGDDDGPYGPLTYTLPAEIPPGSYLDLRRAELQPTEEG